MWISVLTWAFEMSAAAAIGAAVTGADLFLALALFDVLPGLPATIDADAVVTQMCRRASSPGFGSWWRRVESVGYCAHPIQLLGADTAGRQHMVWTRCNNRRA